MHTDLTADAIAALQHQHFELAQLHAQLERARRELLPAPAVFWRGGAQRAYDYALEGVATSADAALAALASARDNTARTLASAGV